MTDIIPMNVYGCVHVLSIMATCNASKVIGNKNNLKKNRLDKGWLPLGRENGHEVGREGSPALAKEQTTFNLTFLLFFGFCLFVFNFFSFFLF